MIGGGSFNWMPRLLPDIMSAEALRSADFRLLDIQPEAAEIIAEVGRRYAGAYKSKATFLATGNAARALDGADFVVITISTGLLDAMEPDIKVPERYGIYQTVGDTVGPGGWARGLRNIPVFADFAAKFQRYCPDAFILNYTNPMTTLTRALGLLTPQPVVGLCHGVFENLEQLQRIFKLKEEKQISARYAGINHFFWILDFTIDGKPGYPMLHRKLRGSSLATLLSAGYQDPAGMDSTYHTVANELFEEFGYMPYVGDRHISEFFGRYLAPSMQRVKSYHLKRTPVSWRKARLVRQRKFARRLASGKEPLNMTKSRETAADIMAARWLGREFVDVMNLPNTGQVENLPYGAVVETPGLVNASGFTPICSGELPPQVLSVTMPHVLNQEMIVEAGLSGDWEMAMQALINDPLCAHLPIPKIKEMGRKLLEANRKHLPRFFGRKRK
jgi:alpha-galactosidase